MPDKRMRPIVKQEPGAAGAQERQQLTAGERDGQRRRVKEEARRGGLEQQLQSLRANADAQALAFQGLPQVRPGAMGEQYGLIAGKRA